MKRELTELQQHALQLARERYPKVNGAFTVTGSELTVERRMGYVSGYTACAESSVPLELFREVVEALKKTAGELFNVKSDAVESTGTPVMEADKIARRNPAYLSAQEVLNKAKSYLP